MRKIKALVLNTEKGMKEAEIEDSLKTYYELIDCDTIDITARKVGDRWYRIVVDDEGLLKMNPVVSAYTEDMEPVLVGNLVFCGAEDEDGYLTSLSQEDIANLKAHGISTMDLNTIDGTVRHNHCIIGCEY